MVYQESLTREQGKLKFYQIKIFAIQLKMIYVFSNRNSKKVNGANILKLKEPICDKKNLKDISPMWYKHIT
jgi:hypothetical protein